VPQAHPHYTAPFIFNPTEGCLQTLLPSRGCKWHGMLERNQSGHLTDSDSILTHPDCLYSLEQVLASQSLSPPLLNGDNNVYFTQLWGRILRLILAKRPRSDSCGEE